MSPSYKDVEAVITDIRRAAYGNARVRRLTDHLTILCRAHFSEFYAPKELAELGLTRMQLRVAAAIFAKPGRLCSKDMLMDVTQMERRGDDANPRMMDQVMAKIRPKLEGTRLSIVTVWGVGYRGVVARK